MQQGGLSQPQNGESHENVVYDVNQRALETLDVVLDEESPDEIIERVIGQTPVEEEIQGKRIVHYDSDRTKSRVLFITRDRAYIDPKSEVIARMHKLSSLFDEVHIMVFVSLGTKRTPKRLSERMWLYPVSAQFWWKLPFVAREEAQIQFLFGDGFRPDIIVALDPFESGLGAFLIGKRFKRSVQVHVAEDFTVESFEKAQKGNFWRKQIAHYVLKRVKSIRTQTSVLEKKLTQAFPKVKDVRVLPQYYNYSAYITAEPAFDIHDRYKEYTFIALAFGALSVDSNLHDTFSAMHGILHNPKIGLVVIGAGPAKALFEEKVKILGIQKNVVFISKPDDLTAYLKTADVLVETSTGKESEETVLRAAAAGLPMIMYETEFRNELFTDGESATMIPPGDVHTLSRNIHAFVNHQSLRIQYREATQHIVKTRLAEDEGAYYRAIRDSIEIALVDAQAKMQQTQEVPQTQAAPA